MKNFLVLILQLILTSHPLFAETKNSDWIIYKPQVEKNAPLEAYCLQPDQINGISIKGDFDGNGKTDKAQLEESKSTNKRRLVVYFDQKAIPFVVEEKPIRYSGNYLKTLKGAGTKSQISYGTCESSEVILTWDAKLKRFKENWISD